MAYIFRRKFKSTDGTEQECRNWTVRFSDHLGIKRELPGFIDKKSSESLGRRLEILAAKRATGEFLGVDDIRWLETLTNRIIESIKKWGLVEPERLAASVPLETHFEDFEAHILARGSAAKHARLVCGRARRLFESCGFNSLADLDGNRVERALADIQAAGLSAQTRNFYRQAVRQFARWAISDNRLVENPFERLKSVNVRVDRRHDRRALTLDECRRLICAAESGETWGQISGHERAMIYRFALTTGLRVGEIRSLTPSSFHLDGKPPSVRIKAASAKNRREVTHPICSNMVEPLRALFLSRKKDEPAFKIPASTHTAEMVRFDLQPAGIVYRDEQGEVVDFHALRHSYVSYLANAGVNSPIVQALARHSTPGLTMRYTHTNLKDNAAALEALTFINAEAD